MFKENPQFNREANPDLHNEDHINQVFESGTKEELKDLIDYYHFTPEEVKIFSHFAKLRRSILDGMRPKVEARQQNNPIATKDELSMGAYQESIEPQVRQTVLDLRKKGYATYGSGFTGFDSQDIYFEKKYLEDFKLPEPVIDKFKNQGVIIETKPNRVKLIFKKEFNQAELTDFWQEIEGYLPDLGESAPPCQLRQAVLFRERQKIERE